MEKLNYKLVQNGDGRVRGEFGATTKNNSEDRIRWAEDFTRIAAENDIACMLWDNSGTKVGEENFGYISRFSYTELFPGIIEALLKAYQ